MICRKCGKELENDAIFCSRCGTRVEVESGNMNRNTYTPPPFEGQYGQPNQPYNNYGNQGFMPFGQPQAKPAQPLAIASLVLGIVSLIVFAIIAGPLGIIFGCIAKNKGNKSGMATAGIICGICGIIGWILIQILFANTILSMF